MGRALSRKIRNSNFQWNEPEFRSSDKAQSTIKQKKIVEVSVDFFSCVLGIKLYNS